jgi:isoquinoline 1-oxidoreductase subunit beta
MSALQLSRRMVLIGGGALGLLIGVGAWRLTAKGPRVAGTADSAGAFLHDWIHIGSDGVVTIRAGQSEMGQGAFTGIATLVAEELGCRLDQLKVETGPASDAFKNIAIAHDSLSPERGFASGDGTGFSAAVLSFAADAASPQVTGGSSTLQDRFTRAREAGAIAREMLIATAARQWSVPSSECAAAEGRIAASRCHAQIARSMDADRQALATGRSSRKGRRLRAIRHRRAPPRHAVRGDDELPDLRREPQDF